MTDRSVTHATLVLDHSYAVPPARVFAAWADPAVKARWFTGAVNPAATPMTMDFRVGGTEHTRSHADGAVIEYEGLFREIVPGERIVVANWIDVNGHRISVSQFTAEFRADGNGTRLVVTEQGAYLDGHDSPDSRAIGIRAQLGALAGQLEDSTAEHREDGMSGDQAPADEQQIRAVLEARLAALRAKDAIQFLAFFDPSIVKFDFAPPLQETGPSVLEPSGLQWWLDTWDGEVAVELAQLSITVGGDVAFCHCLQHIQGIRDDGEEQDMWTRSTLGLKKIDDAWTITHEHNSAPFYMDGSDRPALDLQP